MRNAGGGGREGGGSFYGLFLTVGNMWDEEKVRFVAHLTISDLAKACVFFASLPCVAALQDGVSTNVRFGKRPRRMAP